MTELTEREKKIVHINFIMHSPASPFATLPVETREQMLAVVLKLRGIEYDQREMLDIGQAVINERDMMIKSGLGFLHKHKDSLKHIRGLKLD